MVVAAGGIGSPRLLQASGLREAGEGLTMDATLMVYGFVKEPGIGREPPMTWSYEDVDAGYMLSTLVDPWLLYPIMAGLKKPRYALTWPRWGNVLGVMVKLKDEVSGGVFPDGRIRKPLTPRDRERLAQAEEVCRTHPRARGRGAVLRLLDTAAGHAPERDGAHRHPRGPGPRDTRAGPLRLRRQRLPRGARPADRPHDRRPGQAPGEAPRPLPRHPEGLRWDGSRGIRRGRGPLVARLEWSFLGATPAELLARLDAFPRVVLGETPTPLQRTGASLGRSWAGRSS